MFPTQATDSRYERTDEQVASLLENCRLQRRALLHAAHEVAGGDADSALAHVICWIMRASDELKAEQKAKESCGDK